MFSTHSRKKLSSKLKVSIREKNPPIAVLKDSFKNKFPLDRRKAFPARSLWKNKQNMVFTSQRIRFHYPKWSMKNAFLRYGKTAFSGKKVKENGFLQQEKVFLLKLVSPNFNNGVQHQRKALNKSILFPLNRK